MLLHVSLHEVQPDEIPEALARLERPFPRAPKMEYGHLGGLLGHLGKLLEGLESGGRLGSVLGRLGPPWVVYSKIIRASKIEWTGRIGGSKGGQDGAKMGPKTDQNRSQKRRRKKMLLKIVLGPSWGDLGSS